MEVEETIQMLRIIAQRFQQKHVNYNLVFFRDEIEIFIISLFETRSRFVPSISRASRRDRDLYLLYLVLRDEIENLLYQILNFEKGTRNKKGFLVIEREFSSLILTRFFEIESSRQCLPDKGSVDLKVLVCFNKLNSEIQPLIAVEGERYISCICVCL